MIDVIIPAYIPSELYVNLLNRALASLKTQTYQNFIVHLVFNGLYDDEKNILNKLYLENNIKIYNLNDKKSCAIALNHGIKNSNNKYIAFLAVDDEYMPSKLEKQINFLESNIQYSLLGTAAYEKKHNFIYDYPYIEFREDEQIKSIIERENVICGGSVMLRREYIEKNNILFEEKYKSMSVWPNYNKAMAEDWDMWIKIIKLGGLCYNLPERLYTLTVGTSVER